LIFLLTVAKTKVNVEIDSRIYAQAAEVLNHIGIDQATAIDLFYRKVIALRNLPFAPTLSLDEQLIAYIPWGGGGKRRPVLLLSHTGDIDEPIGQLSHADKMRLREFLAN